MKNSKLESDRTAAGNNEDSIECVNLADVAETKPIEIETCYLKEAPS